MWSARWRPVILTILALVLIWGVAVGGYTLAKQAKVTAENVQAYVAAVDLRQLKGEARAKAIEELEDMLNKLSIEERRRARMERVAWRWFEDMTEDEKGQFIEATMPTGFKQMLTAFEELPEDKRRKTIDNALRRLRESQTKMQAGGVVVNGGDTNQPPLSEELQAKVRTVGLKAFYGQSSARTTAELA